MAAVTSFLIYTILLLAKWYLIFFKKKLKSTILKKVTPPPPLKMENNRGKAKQTKQNDISLAIIDGDVVLFLNVA